MIHNFSWILPGRLAGFGLIPTALGGADLRTLRDQGVGALVSLTEAPWREAADATDECRYLHLPIADMTAPSQEQLEVFVDFVDRAGLDGLATAAHCRAGLGRTGTMLAGYLVAQGATAEQALGELRGQRPGSVETVAQEDAVRAFARLLGARTQHGL